MPSIMSTGKPAASVEIGIEKTPSEGMQYADKEEEKDDILSSYGDEDIIMSVMSRPELKAKLMELLQSEAPADPMAGDSIPNEPVQTAGAY